MDRLTARPPASRQRSAQDPIRIRQLAAKGAAAACLPRRLHMIAVNPRKGMFGSMRTAYTVS